MSMLLQLWHDDRGALVASEYLFIVTILVLGLVVGLTNLRTAIMWGIGITIGLIAVAAAVMLAMR